MFTFIIETLILPNIYIEYDFGSIVAEAQFGGGAFVLFGLVNDFQLGDVFSPDLSVWVKLGRHELIRLGFGITGIFLPEQRSTFPFVIYLGSKITVGPL